jgi:hypothetical protein
MHASTYDHGLKYIPFGSAVPVEIIDEDVLGRCPCDEAASDRTFENWLMPGSNSKDTSPSLGLCHVFGGVNITGGEEKGPVPGLA